MYDLNKFIGTSYKDMDCLDFVSEAIPKYKMLKNLKRKPTRNKFDFKPLKEPENYCIASFEKGSFSGHIGIYFKGYIYHSTNTDGVVAIKVEEALLFNQKYDKIRYYKLKES